MQSLLGVCEYPENVENKTGMNDINGNKIYEDDIVHCKSRTGRANMFVTFEDGKFVMVLCEEFKTHKRGLGHYEIECGKPTPLGVGWISQKNKNNVYVDIENIHIL